MLFAGVDLGWYGKPSGLAFVHWDGASLRVEANYRFDDTPRLADHLLAQTAGRPALLAVDAPLVIPNATGMRPCERESHRLLGKYRAACYPSNLGLPFAAFTSDFSRRCEQAGFLHGDRLRPREPGRFQIEVSPHAATVQLFGLPRIVAYKKGTLAERATGLRRLQTLMRKHFPRLQPSLPGFPRQRIAGAGRQLKQIEDCLDALICAYIGAYWWYWGDEKNTVLGNAKDGYLVVPHRRDAAHRR